MGCINPGMAVHVNNASTQELEAKDQKSKVIIGYLESLRPAWAYNETLSQ